MAENKVILITGASSGLGKAAAEALCDLGHEVYGTSRAAEQGENNPFRLIPLDVTDDASVEAAVARVLAEQGRIDVVINNAGMGYGGAIEETTLAEAKAQFETNFFGMVRVCRAVLPHMRGRGEGLIIAVSSIAGLIGLPYQGFYAASKHAVEGYTETLRLELAPFGVKVALIEPGDTRTRFTANRKLTAEAAEGTVYDRQREITLSIMAHDEETGADPAGFAKAVVRLVNNPNPPLRTVTGPAFQKAAVILYRLAPNFTLWVLRKYYRMP